MRAVQDADWDQLRLCWSADKASSPCVSDFPPVWSTWPQRGASQEPAQALRAWFQEPWHMASPPSPTHLTPRPRGSPLRLKPTETSPPTNSPHLPALAHSVISGNQTLPSSASPLQDQTQSDTPGTDRTHPGSTVVALIRQPAQERPICTDLRHTHIPPSSSHPLTTRPPQCQQ